MIWQYLRNCLWLVKEVDLDVGSHKVPRSLDLFCRRVWYRQKPSREVLSQLLAEAEQSLEWAEYKQCKTKERRTVRRSSPMPGVSFCLSSNNSGSDEALIRQGRKWLPLGRDEIAGLFKSLGAICF